MSEYLPKTEQAEDVCAESIFISQRTHVEMIKKLFMGALRGELGNCEVIAQIVVREDLARARGIVHWDLTFHDPAKTPSGYLCQIISNHLEFYTEHELQSSQDTREAAIHCRQVAVRCAEACVREAVLAGVSLPSSLVHFASAGISNLAPDLMKQSHDIIFKHGNSFPDKIDHGHIAALVKASILAPYSERHKVRQELCVLLEQRVELRASAMSLLEPYIISPDVSERRCAFVTAMLINPEHNLAQYNADIISEADDDTRRQEAWDKIMTMTSSTSIEDQRKKRSTWQMQMLDELRRVLKNTPELCDEVMALLKPAVHREDMGRLLEENKGLHRKVVEILERSILSESLRDRSSAFAMLVHTNSRGDLLRYHADIVPQGMNVERQKAYRHSAWEEIKRIVCVSSQQVPMRSLQHERKSQPASIPA